MKRTPISFFACTVAALIAAPALCRADIKPHFDEDAKPILSQQPGLIEYVESRFQVKETGIAKMPGDDDHAPEPPYIFRARPRGSNGPYNLRLLVQPGPPGHILGIVQEAPSSTPQPAVASKAPVPNNVAPTNPSAQPPALTSDTPSGPIVDSSKTPVTTSPSSSNGLNLAPPPDPAPATH